MENAFTYQKFGTKSALKEAINEINKTRKEGAFFAHEKPISIRLFQASGSDECGSIAYCNGEAIGADWNFKAYF